VKFQQQQRRPATTDFSQRTAEPWLDRDRHFLDFRVWAEDAEAGQTF